ncbi:hypothetical protein Q8A64_01515 [Oxalobacteraceae bacterium R-40]|uniref:Uncharacterized protein n=1 Tax=Keguizhuia sedimenti TaxID=3064264 RepID=A0ABU1BJ95_9BURK|nr:hypothetical protein [Oxalobacteraceae bacterium R-40]
MIVFVATSLTFETTGCSILPFNPLSALLLLRFLPDCGLTEFLLSAATDALPDRETTALALSLPALLAFGETGFFVSFFWVVTGALTSLVTLPAALLTVDAGLLADFEADLLTDGFACAFVCLDCVSDAGFSIGAFEELLDAFFGAALTVADAAFFAVAVSAGFFAAALFLADVTTVFIASLPVLPNAFLHVGTALVIIASRPPLFD